MDSVRKLIREILCEIDGQSAHLEKIVQFDKQTDAPYEVEFSERGFTIHPAVKGQTGELQRTGVKFPARGRMSFGDLEDALNKQIDLELNTADNSSIFQLNQSRMQDIMKYYKPQSSQGGQDAPKKIY